MRLLLSLAPMLCLIAAAPAQEAPPAASPLVQPLTVSQFLARYAAIKSEKDKAKMFNDSIALMSVMGESSKRYKEEIEAQKQAGLPPRACPKTGKKNSFNLDVLAADLLQLPAAEREGPFEAAFLAFLDRRYPCPIA
jgi:hypothetical protein